LEGPMKGGRGGSIEDMLLEVVWWKLHAEGGACRGRTLSEVLVKWLHTCGWTFEDEWIMLVLDNIV